MALLTKGKTHNSDIVSSLGLCTLLSIFIIIYFLLLNLFLVYV